MKKAAIIGVLVAIAAAVAFHLYMSDRGRWTTDPQFTDLLRIVEDQALRSPTDPAIVMQFDPAYEYLGGQQFILYGVADTEQHFFVEKNANGGLQSVFWIQFEAYLPDNSYTYDYDRSPGRLQLGGFDFFVDTEVVQSKPGKRRRGTDGALARQFLQSKGYSLPTQYLYARLVHLTDTSKRKELMIIFVDDLGPSGLTATSLQEGGENAARWPEFEQAMLAKIKRIMTLRAP